MAAGDTIPSRLEKALEMGAHYSFKADQGLVSELKRVNGGYKADLVIICFEGFIPLALEAVERGGTVLFFAGASEGACIPACINDIFWRTEVTLTSSYAGAPADCRDALSLIRSGSVPVEKTISHCLPFEEAGFAFQAVANPVEHNSFKVIMEP